MSGFGSSPSSSSSASRFAAAAAEAAGELFDCAAAADERGASLLGHLLSRAPAETLESADGSAAREAGLLRFDSPFGFVDLALRSFGSGWAKSPAPAAAPASVMNVREFAAAALLPLPPSIANMRLPDTLRSLSNE